MTDRLQKVLAAAGVGSRRVIEQWIRAGRITVNGNIATLGTKVTGRERILVDGRPVPALRKSRPGPRVLLYHKPAGEVCSRNDPEGRANDFRPAAAAGGQSLDQCRTARYRNSGSAAADD